MAGALRPIFPSIGFLIVRLAGAIDHVIQARTKVKEMLIQELNEHPLLILGPDKGSLGYIVEAAEALRKYIYKNFGIFTNVYAGRLNKIRLGGKKVKIDDKVFDKEGRQLTSVGGKGLNECWVFVIDDETSWGSTLFNATFVLVRKLGVSWPRLFTGVVHGKLVQGMKPFYTGLMDYERGTAIEPKANINDAEEWMPPSIFVATESVHLPKDFIKASRVSIGPLITWSVKRVINAKLEDMHTSSSPISISKSIKKNPGIYSLVRALDNLGILADFDRAQAVLYRGNPVLTVTSSRKTLRFNLPVNKKDFSIKDLASALAKNELIDKRLKQVISGVDSLFVEPIKFRNLGKDSKLVEDLINGADFLAVNVILPRILGGGGDFGVVLCLSRVFKEIYPKKTIRLVFHKDTLKEAVRRGFVKGFNTEGPFAQEINGIVYVNLSDENMPRKNSIIGKEDICVVFAVSSEEEDLHRSLFKAYGNERKLTVIVKDPGMESRLSAESRFGNDGYLVEPEFRFDNWQGKKYKIPGVVGLFSPPKRFIQQLGKIGVKNRSKRKSLLKDLKLDTRIASSLWGVLYANSQHSIEIYFDLFSSARDKETALNNQKMVFFAATGGFLASYQALFRKAQELGFRMSRFEPKTGEHKPVVDNHNSNVEIISFDFIGPDEFNKLLILADDLPALVRGAITLSCQYYISAVTGRPFLFESSFWQDSLDFDLFSTAKFFVETGAAGLPASAMKYADLQLLSQMPGKEQGACDIFYSPSARQVFRYFTSECINSFDFKQRIKLALEHVWTKYLGSQYSPLLRAIADLREQRGLIAGKEEVSSPVRVSGQLSLLSRLGLNDGLDGYMIYGQPIKDWVKAHQLYYEYPETRNFYEERDARIFAENIYRDDVKRIRETILRFGISIGREASTLESLKGRFSKRKLYPLILWVARGSFITQEKQKRAGKLFAKIDISGMQLRDLPVWPVDEQGSVLDNLLDWMMIKNRAPPFAYYQARKVSLAEFLKKSPAGQPRQLDLFDFSSSPVSYPDGMTA
jgi:hypothetical protein